MRLVLVFRAGRIESKIFPDCFGRTGKKHRGLICPGASFVRPAGKPLALRTEIIYKYNPEDPGT